MNKNWKELKAAGPAAARDLAAALLIDAGSPGVVDGSFATPDRDVLVCVSGWGDAEGVEIGGEGGGDRAELTAYLPEGPGPAEGRGGNGGGIEELAERLGRIGWTFTVASYSDTDWTVKWRSGIRPVRVSRRGRSVLVKPTWSRARPRPGEAAVEIDPGMAFGTGSHSTTRLCIGEIIELLDGNAGLSVLDVGCGTGVLAIAAVKLGAGKAVGTDIDPMAVRAARANVRANGVKATMTERPVESLSGRFDIVVANILSGELTRLAPELVKKTAPGGRLVLSGILAHETERVAEVFTEAGMEFVKRRVLGEWAALVLARPLP